MNDTPPIADIAEWLQRLVNVFGKVCWKRKLKENLSESKVMVVRKLEGMT